MQNEKLVRLWKDPTARQGDAVDHPAGDIRLRVTSKTALRMGLLAGLTVGLAIVTTFEAVTPTTSLSPGPL